MLFRSCFIKKLKPGRTVYQPHKFPFNEGFLIASRVKRLEWYVQIFVKRVLKGGKLQHVRRGISIEKQIQKRDATFANTISKFDSISLLRAFRNSKRVPDGYQGPHQMAKMSSIKRLYSLKVLGVIFHNILLVMKHEIISYRKIV